MPILLTLSLLAQVACVIHVMKTGRDRTWIWVIMLFSFLGCIVYFVVEVLPEVRRSSKAKAATAKVLKVIDPQRDLKRLAEELAFSDNVDNKLKLARECVEASLYDEAIQLYQGTLNGIYQHDPHIMLELAKAFFQQGNYAKSKETLDNLLAKNPDFKSPEGHMLYARSLEALQETTQALQEYEVLASYYIGYEAKCRYALLLKKNGYTEKASALFKDIIKHANHMPKHYRKLHKQWITVAEQNLQ